MSITKTPQLTSGLGATLSRLMKLRDINMNQLHKITGLPLTTINRMVNDLNLNPTMGSLIPVAEYFNVTLEELIGLAELDEDVVLGRRERINWRRIPIIGWNEVIQFRSANKNGSSATITTDLKMSKGSFGLVVNDQTLEEIPYNSKLLIDPQTLPNHGDLVLINKLSQPHCSLKRILVDDDINYLKPLSKELQTIRKTDQHIIIGTVMQIRIDYRAT